MPTQQDKPNDLIITPEKLWPKELLYWRRMSSKHISDYKNNTPKEKRLLLYVWGTIESHGPVNAVANDTFLAAIAADKVAKILYEQHGIQPIIVDTFKDVGTPSATWEFPGALGYESLLKQLWEQTLARTVEKEGFKRHFIVNGDGGNWLNVWSRLKWESGYIRKLIHENKIILDGSNWDQEEGEPYVHAGVYDHALIVWACNYAPEFERLSALRHGFRAATMDEIQQANIDGVDMAHLEDEPYRTSDWSQYPGQDKYLSVTEFTLKKYKEVLYNPDGTARTKGGVQADYEAKIDNLMERILAVMKAK